MAVVNARAPDGAGSLTSFEGSASGYTCGTEFTEEDLKKAVIHLAFDVQHFRCYVTLHKNTELRQACPAASQAVAYSLLLHLRLLLDFFYGPPKKDDCWVGHFGVLPGFSAAFSSRAASPTRHEAREISINLHKRLAHLTATRWQKSAPSMNYYQQYFDDMDKLIDKFEAALPGDVRRLFVTNMHKWENRHPAIIRFLAAAVHSESPSSPS